MPAPRAFAALCLVVSPMLFAPMGCRQASAASPQYTEQTAPRIYDWTVRNSGMEDLSSVFATSDGKRAWAVGKGGTIIRWSEGGQPTALVSGTQNPLWGIFGAGDGSRLWAVGGGGIILQSDGTQWAHVKSVPPVSGALWSISGSNDGRRLWAAGSGGILTSGNGERWDWEFGEGFYLSSYIFKSVFATRDGSRVWAVGLDGAIVESDHGQRWVRRESRTNADVLSVFATSDGKRVWAVADKGLILTSMDGEHWTVQKMDATIPPLSVSGTSDGKRLWAVGSGGSILESQDGGEHWASRSVDPKIDLRSVFATDDGNHVWAVGTGGAIVGAAPRGIAPFVRGARLVPSLTSKFVSVDVDVQPGSGSTQPTGITLSGRNAYDAQQNPDTWFGLTACAQDRQPTKWHCVFNPNDSLHPSVSNRFQFSIDLAREGGVDYYNFPAQYSPWPRWLWPSLAVAFVAVLLLIPFLLYFLRPRMLWTRALRLHPLTRVVRLLPRAMDAWVYAEAQKLSKLFYERGYPKEFLPIPLRLDGAPFAGFSPYRLHSAFKRPKTIVLVWGESGTGKTRLAYNAAEKAGDKYPYLRPAQRHPMLPLLIEDDPFTGESNPSSWTEAILAKMKDDLGPQAQSRLYLRLLRSKRILVLIDGLSEMSQMARLRLERELPESPARALMVTSDLHETFPGAVEIEMAPIPAGQLSVSIDAYLRACRERESFSDEEFLESVPRLARLAGGPVPIGLLRVYCDVMIALKRRPGEFPKNVPELMERYRDAQVGPRDAAAANELAWRCVQADLQSIPAEGIAAGLKSLFWTVGADRVKFSLPLLADFLGAIHLVETLRNDLEGWRIFLSTTQRRSFLNAMRDVIAAKAEDLDISEEVVGEMIPLLGEPLPRVRQDLRSRRVDKLVAELSRNGALTPDLVAQKAHELAAYGADARPAVPVLRTFVRQGFGAASAVVEALGNIDPASRDEVLEEQRRTQELDRWRERLLQLLPKENPSMFGRISIAHRYEPAEGVAGDFYMFIPRPDDSVGICMIDVEGHGPRAASNAARIYDVLTHPPGGAAWGWGEPRAEIESADHLLAERDLFTAMSFTEIDRDARRLRFASAGMRPAMLFRSGESTADTVFASGVYAGKGYAQYPSRRPRAETAIADGDLLILFSDGIVEARDPRGRAFGYEGITAAVAANRWNPPLDIAGAIISAVKAHSGLEHPDDDQTLAVVQIGQVVRQAFAPSTLETARKDDRLEFLLRHAADTGPTEYSRLRPELLNWVTPRLAYGEHRARQIWIATREAIANAFKHGSVPGQVIRIRVYASEEDLTVELAQPEPWSRWDTQFGQARREQVRRRNTAAIQLGLGTAEMILFSDAIEVSPNAQPLRLIFKRKSEPKGRGAHANTR